MILCTIVCVLSANAWSSKDHYCITQAIYYEARGESYAGKIAIGHVILNRISKGYGNDPCDVISRKKQFSWFGKNIPIREKNLWMACEKISRDVISRKTIDPTSGSIFFHEKSIRPRWRYKKTTSIGSHIFYK
jgi:spore germination cell wall hydrolase CwlJ-like protein